MDVSGDVADLVVIETLQVGETAVRLTASGIKHVAALLLALSKSDRKVIGKTSIKKLARDPTPAMVLPLHAEDVKRFQKLAREYGVLYVLARPKGKEGDDVDIISNERYAVQLNALYQSMGYPLPEREAPQQEDAAKKATARAPQERSSPERGSGLTQPQTKQTSEERKPSVKSKLAALEYASKGQSHPERTHIKTR